MYLQGEIEKKNLQVHYIIKGNIISESFSHPPKNVLNHYPELLEKRFSRVIWHIFEG